MNELMIFVVRLIIGLVCGIFLTRLFHPEWSVMTGAAIGFALVALVYGMRFFRKKSS